MTESKPEQTEPLAKLREPFPAHQISKLPKPTKTQTDEVRANFKVGVRCAICGSWHHPQVIHLDYVGHAALTRPTARIPATSEWYAGNRMALQKTRSARLRPVRRLVDPG